MNFETFFKEPEEEFIFNAFDIDNHSECTSSRLRFWYQHIRDFATDDKGDIFEFGVFRGASLISVAILLKKLNSTKKIYGFDSFKGFPSYSHYDELDCFYKYSGIHFEEALVERFNLLKKIRELRTKKNINKKNISSVGEFTDTSLEQIKSKLDFFELDNVELIEGDFKETVPNFFDDYTGTISSANIDCDLYEGYKICLPYIWENLMKSGYVHLDEYYSLKFPGARIACNQFFEEKKIIPQKQAVRDGEFERWYFTK